MRANKTLSSASWLRWLLGETLVVVLGILIALSLDDFWIDHQERQLELLYVDRMIEDLRADVDYVDNTIRDLWIRKLEYLDAIAPVVRGYEPIPEDVEAFLRSVSLGGIGGASSTRWVTNTTFDELKSTGNLRLIRNTELRRNIARYYDEFDTLYNRARDRKSGYVSFVHTLLPAELRGDMDINAMQEFGLEAALAGFTSVEFQGLLNQEYNYTYFVQQTEFGSSGARLLGNLEAYRSTIRGDLD